MEAQLRELISFLRDKNPQVRQIALTNLLPQTLKDAPHRHIFLGTQSTGLKKADENAVVRDLKLLCRDQLAVAHDAFKALVNLSDSPLLVSSLSEPSFLNFIVSYIINPQSILSELASMLLSNLTASASACSLVVQMKISVIATPSPNLPNGFYATDSRSGSCTAPVPYPKGEEQHVLALPLLLDAFAEGANVDTIEDPEKRARKSGLHFLASVFANLASSSAGREFFFTPRPPSFLHPDAAIEYPIAKIIGFTEHPNTIRRGGIASTIKNLAFNPRAHRALLSPESSLVCVPPSQISAPGVSALTHLLLPLAGPEELDLDVQDNLPEALQFLPPDKKREPDEAIRLIFVETLLLLCHTRWGREFFRGRGVYEVVRSAHEVEGVEVISTHVERLVQLLKGEEPPESEAVPEEEEYDAMPEDDLPPEARLIQGLGTVRSNAIESKDEKEEEEDGEEVMIEPLGADSDSEDEDGKIVEV